jgi:hypothetical protein
MTNDDFTPIFIVTSCCLVLGFAMGAVVGTISARGETEEKTIVYCIEQPSACKVKYDYYKLEARK